MISPPPPVYSSPAAVTLQHASAMLPAARQVVPVTIYHLSMTHAHCSHTRTHTQTRTYTLAHSRTVISGPQAKAFNMQFMFATRSITGNSHMPSTQWYVEAFALATPPKTAAIKQAGRQAGRRASRVGAQIAVSGHGSCGKSKSSSKTKLDYFVRSTWSVVQVLRQPKRGCGRSRATEATAQQH